VSTWESRAAALPGLRCLLSKTKGGTYSDPSEPEPADTGRRRGDRRGDGNGDGRSCEGDETTRVLRGLSYDERRFSLFRGESPDEFEAIDPCDENRRLGVLEMTVLGIVTGSEEKRFSS
jgi:hypothetical protein